MSHHRIEMDDVSFFYPDGTPALREVSFSIGHGESVALVGANGSGKTTLLLHLIGFLEPAEGTVLVGDWRVGSETQDEVRRSIGTVFQDPDDQLFMPTVYDDVAFGPLNLGLPAEEVARRTHDALTRVGAWELRERPPYRLSGGEKREVSIATALAMEPNILVMDEPSSNLDPRARRRLIDLLAGFGHSKLIATHDLDLALDLCARTLVMKEGRLIADGPTGEIFCDDALLEEGGLERPLSMGR